VLRVLLADCGVVDGAQEYGFSGLPDQSNRATAVRCPSLTAYAIRSPLGSEESGVGWPRVVVGDAAQIASAHFSNNTAYCALGTIPDTRDMFVDRKDCRG
jgi:hypothetical protein